jgi:hypothetical protein
LGGTARAALFALRCRVVWPPSQLSCWHRLQLRSRMKQINENVRKNEVLLTEEGKISRKIGSSRLRNHCWDPWRSSQVPTFASYLLDRLTTVPSTRPSFPAKAQDGQNGQS